MTTQANSFHEDNQNTQDGQVTVNGLASPLSNEEASVNVAMSPSMAPSPGSVPQRGMPASEATVPQGEVPATQDDLTLDFRHMPSVDAGEYRFSDSSVALQRNHPTRFGIRNQVALTFLLELPAGTLPLEQKYIASNSKDAQFNRIVTQMLGQPVGKTFDCRALVGRTGKLRVIHNTTAEGDTFANVEQVWDCDPKSD